ncbi:SigE family RNA polymerase sigma factor [Streptomyces sp. NBC_00160]|uniref:SigE family RNA polymerase sigma factor n=1 Tax=Streptomyces sp. NBC_00160 TaxID=2903628 RepID=UPI001F3A63A3|nr:MULTISPECIES: SigE family RNA polymerase sigma factor [Streptomyces]MCM9080862.1 SigE family RNA polymerase sigma factor [Streptomyces spororaveus]MCX5304712.1 SigE family RNA polymerase sigma factor [Streptomyces sp. NBC_00160]
MGIIPSRRGSRVPGGGFPVIVPVPPAGPSETPVRTAVPIRGGLVPAQRDSADTDGSGKSEAAGTAEAVEAVEATEAVAEVVAGTTVDHLTATYQAHYRSLLGLAALLLDDTASCEDVVQEAFIRVHSARNRVRDREKTLAYLRQTVVNLSRSALRRRILGLKLLSKPMPDMASAEEGAYDQLERDDLIKAMRGLQRRQREVLVLRYFADMTESQVAETLGISLGSVKAYGSRGIAALRVAMEAAQS